MRFAGELAALGTAVCWASGVNFFATAAQRMGPVVLNRLRLTTACVLLMLAMLVVRGTPWPHWATATQLGLLAASGVIGFVFGDTWTFRSIVILGPGRASLLASTAPLFTIALAWPLLHERPGPLALLGMAMTVGGIAWVLGVRAERGPVHAEGSAAFGVVAGLLGGLGQAGGYVLSKGAIRSGLDPLSATVVRVASAMVAIWVLAAAQRAVPATLTALRDRRAAAFMVAGSVLGPFLGVTLSLMAIRYVDTGVAASIIAISPLFALMLAARFHGEKLDARTWAGALLAVAGVVVLFLR